MAKCCSKTSRFIYVYISMLITIALSFTLMTIPWILGFVIPILIGLIVFGLLSSKKEILHFIKRALLFLIVILSSQAFWLAGFITPYIFVDKNSLANKFVSKEFLDTFDPTILVTATGSILYPLLNLYHRQIAFDFGWHLKNIFVSTYDKTYLLNFLFVVGLGILFSSINVFFRDLSHFLSIGFMVWFWITPVFYSLDVIPASFRWVCIINPATHYITLYHDILFYTKIPSLPSILSALFFSLASIVIGYVFFLIKESALLKKI